MTSQHRFTLTRSSARRSWAGGKWRQAGVMLWRALGGLALAGGAGGAWWASADYRVEQRPGSPHCSIVRNMLPPPSHTVASQLSFPKACQTAASTPSCVAMQAGDVKECETHVEKTALSQKTADYVIQKFDGRNAPAWGYDGPGLRSLARVLRFEALIDKAYEPESSGGNRCNGHEYTHSTLYEVMNGRSSKCLAFLADNGAVITAGHCLGESGTRVKVKVLGNEGKGVDATCARPALDYIDCKVAAGQIPPAKCGNDIAICTSSNGSIGEPNGGIGLVSAQAASNGLRDLSIVSRGTLKDGQCTKVDIASKASFVPSNGNAYVEATFNSILAFESGDSGGLAFQCANKKCLAVGVNTRQGETALIAPVWNLPNPP
jgi:Trypsin